MTKIDELMGLVAELVGSAYAHRGGLARVQEQILRKALEAALVQGEPVAWGMSSLAGIVDCITPEEHESYEGDYKIPLYTAPPAPVQGKPIQCEPQPAVTEDGFCEWVCPTPSGYLMQCCDCGLIHEVEFRVAKYEPRPSEEFEVLNDPDMLCQLRMKRRDDLCHCKDRPASECPGEWEPGCDLGNNENYARPYPPPRLTPEQRDKAYRSAGGGVQGLRAIESAVRKQFGVKDE